MTVSFYVGVPGTGKTTAAYNDAAACSARRGAPLIVIDSEGVMSGMDSIDVSSLRTYMGAGVVEHLLDDVWSKGHHARYVPDGAEDVDLLCNAIRGGGEVVLLVDEVSYWARGNACLPALARLLRVHRHARVDVFMTSQYPADVAQVVWACKTDVRIFRNDTARALQRLEAEGVVPVDRLGEVSDLPRGASILWSRSL